MIDNQKKSMLLIEAGNEENLFKFFNVIEAMVLRNSDPQGHNMLALDDMPSILTASGPFANSAMTYPSVSAFRAKHVDDSGKIGEINQVNLSKPVLPQVWRSVLESLRKAQLPFTMLFTSDARTLVHLRRKADPLESGGISRLEFSGGEAEELRATILRAPLSEHAE